MSYNKQKFSQSEKGEFLSVLRKRVNEYLEIVGRSRYGNWTMVIKTIFMFALYFSPYFLTMFGVVTNPAAVIILWMIMGLGMAGIGLSVSHDANHGSYSRKKWVNNWLGKSLNLMGANAEMWKLQHNVLHHTYTNIQSLDEDIDTPKFLRFSPHRERQGIHKFQFIYIWFFYGLTTLSWITSKEFLQVNRYKKLGLIKDKKTYKSLLTELIVWKVLYFAYMLVLPLIFFPIAWWLILVAFFAMHFTAGMILSLIFQTAHVMPDCEYPVVNDEGIIENSWAVHEMQTTSNYAPKSRVFSWLIGGLNYQVEHHLFPSICHIHYKHISKIVAETAAEYNLPYHSQTNFVTAVWNHVKMLYRLGRLETQVA
ncbi:MAG: acyl-CoA desaturase [Bacteroidia bacterium]|nr:acyl-CoA desaturase [Bacteroidia bacterium]